MARENKNKKMADEIIAAIKNGTAPWVKPWTPDNSAVPYNPVTGTKYKGVNHIYLSMQGGDDPRWVTFKQAQKKGWQVKPGSRGTSIQFWQFEKDEKVRNDNGEIVTKRVKMERPLLRYYYVFNGSQINGIPPIEPLKKSEWDRHDRSENLLKKSGANIQHVKGDRAFYSPGLDTIKIPEPGQFNTSDKYYATVLHELGHWTGHESRLNRKFGNVFGSDDYAREELRAEIASYMLGMELGIGHDPGQHLAYVNSWIKVLENDPTEIFRACADAEKIQSFILAFEQERDQKKEAETMQKQQPHYIVMEQNGAVLSQDMSFVDLYDDKIAKYNTPVDALRAANNAKKSLGKKLENSELYIHRFNPPDNLEVKKILETGLAPGLLKQQWAQNIGGNLPREFLSQSENQSQPFLTFVGKLNVKNDNQIEIQPQVGKRNSAGVLRLDSPLWIDHPGRTKDDLIYARNKGHDGIVYTDKGKVVAAIAINKKQIHKTMFQAAKGLDKKYLAVPFTDKNEAKEFGAIWHKKAQSWYIPDGLDPGPFVKWQHSQSRTFDNPQQQFADFIRSMGGDLKGSMPIMDGKIHRIPEIGAKKGNKNIAYAGYMDGVPGGWVKNWRGDQKNWKAKGIVLTDQDRTRLKKESAEKKLRREKKRQELYLKTAKASETFTRDLPEATGKEKYFIDKNLNLEATGAKTDKKGNIILPMKDINGKQWSHLTLHPNGFKQVLKDSRLQGCFAIVGLNNLNEIKGDLNLAEGYSTAATIHEVTGEPVLIAGTGNNLKHVARALRDRYPERNIFVLADDDKYLVEQGKVNAGRVQGREAAKSVDGHVIYPNFVGAKTSKENTDFRDMAKMRGKEAVADYIAAQKDLSRAKQRKKLEQEKDKNRETEPALEQ